MGIAVCKDHIGILFTMFFYHSTDLTPAGIMGKSGCSKYNANSCKHFLSQNAHPLQRKNYMQ